MRTIVRYKGMILIDGQCVSHSFLARIRLAIKDFSDWLHYSGQLVIEQDNKKPSPFPIDQAAALRRGATLYEVTDARAVKGG